LGLLTPDVQDHSTDSGVGIEGLADS